MIGVKHSPERHKNQVVPKAEAECPHCSSTIRFLPDYPRIYCNRTCWSNHVDELRTVFEKYKFKCKFEFNVWDYPKWFNLSLIVDHGWYSASNRGGNLGGVSRDHRLSVMDGFKLQVDPKVMAHPANCELMTHPENSKKRAESSTTLEELLESITNFEKLYGALTKC